MPSYTDNQGMYSYLLNGGMLCPLDRESYAHVQKAIRAYVRDTGDDSFWIEVETDPETGEQFCVEEQEWV